VTFSHILVTLQSSLARELPGAAAHVHLAPIPRRQWPAGFNPARVRRAAGLLLVFPVHDHAHIVLTERAHTLERHGGQISLPGGVVEPGETFEHAALREAHEEIALPARGVTVIGALTPLDIPVSGFRLHPIVASAQKRPPLRPADGEVARIIDVRVDDLLRPETLTSTVRTREGHQVDAPAFRVSGVEIWGATAMVLSEFLVLLGWTGPGTR
jgi:8-oxo-dGTP pyrophosphatase MutT (NUDIX family)